MQMGGLIQIVRDPREGRTKIVLTAEEMAHAQKIGDERHSDSRQRGLVDRCTNQPAERKRNLEMEAAAAEKAASIAFGYPGGEDVGTFKKPDVGDYIQVRHTEHLNGRLIVRPGDKDGDFYVLVTGCRGTYEIAGWKWGLEAKDDQWWTDPGGWQPAWFVPRFALEPFHTLKELLNEWPKRSTR